MLCKVFISFRQHTLKTFNELKIIHRCADKRKGNRGDLRFTYGRGGGVCFYFFSVEPTEGKRRNLSKRIERKDCKNNRNLSFSLALVHTPVLREGGRENIGC